MAEENLIAVGDAIVYDLNAASTANTFNRDFESELLLANRKIELEKLNVLRIDVAPFDWSEKLIVRGVTAHTLRYDIGVRKRFEASESEEEGAGKISNQEIRDLIKLLGSVCRFFMPGGGGEQLSQFPRAQWRPEKELITNLTINWEDLEIRQFTGSFPITYWFGEE